MPDPAAASGSDVVAALADAYDRLGRRIDAFLALPVRDLAGAELKSALDSIGRLGDEA